MAESSGHLGRCHEWPGPRQTARAVTQALLCFLCLRYPSLPSFPHPFPTLRVANSSFAHITTLPSPVLAPLPFPQSSEMSLSLCLLPRGTSSGRLSRVCCILLTLPRPPSTSPACRPHYNPCGGNGSKTERCKQLGCMLSPFAEPSWGTDLAENLPFLKKMSFFPWAIF